MGFSYLLLHAQFHTSNTRLTRRTQGSLYCSTREVHSSTAPHTMFTPLFHTQGPLYWSAHDVHSTASHMWSTLLLRTRGSLSHSLIHCSRSKGPLTRLTHSQPFSRGPLITCISHWDVTHPLLQTWKSHNTVHSFTGPHTMFIYSISSTVTLFHCKGAQSLIRQSFSLLLTAHEQSQAIRSNPVKTLRSFGTLGYNVWMSSMRLNPTG